MGQSFFDIILNKDEDKLEIDAATSSPLQPTTPDLTNSVFSVAGSSVMSSPSNSSRMPPPSSFISPSAPGAQASESRSRTTSLTLPPLRPSRSSQPSAQAIAPTQSIERDDFEAAVILACIKDEEEDRNASKSGTSTGNMTQRNVGGPERARRGTPPTVKRYIASVNRVVGGYPKENASKEVWDDYLNKFMNENNRRQQEDAEKSWTQLAKAEQFVKKMGQQPFRLLGEDSDEEELPKSTLPTTPAKQRGQVDRSRAALKNDFRKVNRRVKSVDENEQSGPPARDEVAASPTALGNTQSPTQLSPNSLQVQSTARPKRRRTGPESLQSSLGKKWEATVDEEGHRPARRAKKTS